MNPSQEIVKVEKLSHQYQERKALNQVSFEVNRGEIFGFLGPNGSGKTTLFRILSTFFPVSHGDASINGYSLKTQATAVRKKMGVVFQYPSLDDKLTVNENLVHQGHLYSLSGNELKARIEELLKKFDITDRKNEIVSKLSGGLKRRVEISKSLLHQPDILLLDEPSNGLDPGARKDMWNYLKHLNQSRGLTLLVTTHLMDEAEECHRLLIMSRGQIVASGTPEVLKREIGGEVLIIKTKEKEMLAEDIQKQLGIKPQVKQNELHIEHKDNPELLTKVFKLFPERLDSALIRRPTLEDVFLKRTGHHFTQEDT